MTVSAFSAESGALINSVPELRKLSVEQAQQGLPLDLQGQVIYIHHKLDTCVVYDDGRGAYVYTEPGRELLNKVSQGDIIRVRGRSSEGGFAPSIEAESVEVLDQQPLPDGKGYYDDHHMHPNVDCKWVREVGRIVNHSSMVQEQHILVEVERHSRIFDVLVPYSKESEDKLAELQFRVVSFDSVAATVFNEQRQAIGRILLVSSAEDFKTDVQYAQYEKEDEVAVHELVRFSSPFRSLIKTSGTVIYQDAHEMYIRGAKACLRILHSKPTDAVLGNHVAAVGFPEPGPVSPSFRARSIEVLEEGAQPEPVRVELGEAIDPSLNYELIEIEAVLVEHGKRFDVDGLKQPTLLCRAGEHLFEVRYPSGYAGPDHLSSGSKLRLTGVCDLIRGSYQRWRLHVVGFQLRLRSPEDVVVLVPPPWWNSQRLLWLAGITLSSAIVLLAWVFMLRKTVARQTRIITDQVEVETLQHERQRIARELHDTLAQSLVGMGIQLRSRIGRMTSNMAEICQALREGAPEGDPKQAMADQIEQAASEDRASLMSIWDNMGRCSEEARSSIVYLRSGKAGRMGLITVLKEVLEPLANEIDVQLGIKVMGEPRAIKEEAERGLMLTTKEAVTNAIRHSSAEQIHVLVTYTDTGLQIEVRDEGNGFDPEAVQKRGHYGLVGMKERVKQLGGTLEVDSVVGKGTVVCIVFESTETWEV